MEKGKWLHRTSDSTELVTPKYVVFFHTCTLRLELTDMVFFGAETDIRE